MIIIMLIIICVITIFTIIVRHHTNVALLLLHSGADFDLADSEGETPIHICAREGMLGLSQVRFDSTHFQIMMTDLGLRGGIQ